MAKRNGQGAAMYPMLSPELSKELDGVFKKGNLAGFVSLAKDLDANSLLHSTARKNAFPMLKRVLNGRYKMKSYQGRLAIAEHLLSAGADASLAAPYGFTALGSVLHELVCLDVVKSKLEAHMETLRFAYRLVDVHEVDLSVRGKQGRYVLDDAVFFPARYPRQSPPDLASRKLLIRMLERGAPRSEWSDNNVVLAEHEEHLKAPKRVPVPFPTHLDPSFAKTWRSASAKGHAELRAITLLKERAFKHCGWGFGAEEEQAVARLLEAIAKLEKTAQRPLKSAVTKVSKPLKPCFDEAVYEKLLSALVLLK